MSAFPLLTTVVREGEIMATILPLPYLKKSFEKHPKNTPFFAIPLDKNMRVW
jgi:hypothetical protein